MKTQVNQYVETFPRAVVRYNEDTESWDVLATEHGVQTVICVMDADLEDREEAEEMAVAYLESDRCESVFIEMDYRRWLSHFFTKKSDGSLQRTDKEINC